MTFLARFSRVGPPPGAYVPVSRPASPPSGRPIPVPTGGASQPFREQGELFPIWRAQEDPQAAEARDGAA